MRVLLQIAARNLLAARRRTASLGLAIATVTTLLVLLQAMSQGITDTLVRQATVVSAGHVVVGGFYKVSPTEAAPIVTEVSRIKADVREAVSDVAMVTDRHRGWGKIISDTGSVQAGLNGVDFQAEPEFTESLQWADESDYKEGGADEPVGQLELLGQPNTILVFANHARRLGVGVGDLLTVQTETSGGRTNTIDVTVVAVAKDLGMLTNWVAFLPKSDVMELYQYAGDTTGALWVYLDDVNKADDAMRKIRTALTDAGHRLIEHQSMPFYMKFEEVTGEDWTGQKLDVTTWEDEVSFLTWVLTAFDTVTWFLITILVAIIAMGIMNTMVNAVRERTAEIGTLRAIGMQRRAVLTLILLEATILGFVATTAGAVIGASIACSLDLAQIPVPIAAMQTILLSDTLRLSVHWSTLFSAILVLTLFTAGAALWPAARAANLRPITALQHVE